MKDFIIKELIRIKEKGKEKVENERNSATNNICQKCKAIFLMMTSGI